MKMNGKDHSGQVLDGRYRLVKKLDEGGMGAVYLGEHAVIGRKVAVKLLHAEFSSRVSIVKRFYREAQASTAIKHKNVIDVYDVGEAPWGEPYMVMEYLEGTSLGAVLRRMHTLDLPTACGILEQVLCGLEAAHRAGVVHRDLKPENIFLVETDDDPLVKIIDFGISKFVHEPQLTQLTQEGAILGTPDYMAPEQARGDRDIGPACDIYSVGVIMYQMLTGTTPHAGANYHEVIVHILTQKARHPREVCPTFPQEAEDLVVRALECDPAMRFPSALAMLEAVRNLPSYKAQRSLGEALRGQGRELVAAAGDLGATLSAGATPGMAAEVMQELVRERTPGAWAMTGRPSAVPRATPPTVRPLVLVFAAIGAAIAATIAVVSLSWLPGLRGESRSVPQPVATIESPQVPSSESPARGIEITVAGAPEGATVYYDGALVPGNPFKVDKKETLSTLRVEAPGYETTILAVVPDEDQIVEVSLTKAAVEESVAKASTSLKSKAEKQAKSARGGALSESQRRIVYVKGRRQLKACYDAALRSGAAPKEQVLTVSAVLSVAKSGLVSNVKLRGSGAQIPSLSRCLEKTMLDWTYPPSEQASTVEHDFAFTPSE